MDITRQRYSCDARCLRLAIVTVLLLGGCAFNTRERVDESVCALTCHSYDEQHPCAGDVVARRVSGRIRGPSQSHRQRRVLCAGSCGHGLADHGSAVVGTSSRSALDGREAIRPQHSGRDSRLRSPATRTAAGACGKAAGDRAVVSRVAAAGRRADSRRRAERSALYLGRFAADRRRQQPATSASGQRRGSGPRQS